MATPELHVESQPVEFEYPAAKRLRLSKQLGETISQRSFVQTQLQEVSSKLITVTDDQREGLLQFRDRLSRTLLDIELQFDHTINKIYPR